MRRLFAIVLLSAQIVFVSAFQWPPKATVLWLRQLGGKLGLASDRDGPYWLQHGISAVITTAMTLSFDFLCTLSLSRRILVGNHQLGNSCFMVILMVRYTRRLSIGLFLFFLGGINLVNLMRQLTHVKVSGLQLRITIQMVKGNS